MRVEKKEVRSSKQQAPVTQYRAIGPAAIAAALIHMSRKKQVVQKITTPRPA